MLQPWRVQRGPGPGPWTPARGQDPQASGLGLRDSQHHQGGRVTGVESDHYRVRAPGRDPQDRHAEDHKELGCSDIYGESKELLHIIGGAIKVTTTSIESQKNYYTLLVCVMKCSWVYRETHQLLHDIREQNNSNLSKLVVGARNQ